MDRYWPERVALFLIALIAVALLFLGTGAKGAYSDAWFSALASILGRVSLVVVGPIWALLRAADVLFIDPRRRQP